MAINNPYIPGDPYSYDLKWIVSKIKAHDLDLSTLDERIHNEIIRLLDQHDPVYFGTAEDLIHSEMNTPSIAYIEGFNSIGDGGANLYYITSDYNDVLASNFYITLDGANRWGIPVIMTPWVFPEMFGAYGDGSEDDTTAVQTCFLYKKPIYMAKDYLITSQLHIDYPAIMKCDGSLIYDGTGAAIVVSYSYVHLYIRELRSNASGIEMRPDGNSINTNCQLDIIECDRILLTGSGGNGLYINSSNGLTQFCKFIINRLQGGFSLSTNVGLKIKCSAQADKYCNANLFEIHSICFFATGILTDTVANSCISNYFRDINFEQNTTAVNIANSRYEMSANFDEGTAGKFVINTGVNATIRLNGIMNENKFDFDPNTVYSSNYKFYGQIVNANGVQITDNLLVTSRGFAAVNQATPFNASVLTNVTGTIIVKYITNGDTLDVPSVRKGGIGGYPLAWYAISYYTTGGSSGSVTLNFADGNTVTVNYTSNHGLIVVTPNSQNTAQWVHYLPNV